MQKIKIKLENCYGIKELEKEFDFTQSKSFVIYAPNGAMKTSFAKTFQDLSEGVESIDRIYKDRETKRVIQDENGVELQKEQIFTIESLNQYYKSSKISTLLVNKTLKEEYDKIYLTINEKKEILIKELQTYSGLKKDVEETLSDAITHDRKEFFLSLNRVKHEVFEKKQSALSVITYPIIFNDKVLAVLESKAFRDKLGEYIEIYDRLVSSSNFFKKGIFNHNNANDIAKSLKDNGYFKAKHSVNINVGKAKKEITTEAELEKAIQQEKDSILENTALIKSFDEIDKKLIKNKDLKIFREYLEKNKAILAELENLDRFKQKLWVSYLTKSIDPYKNLIEAYDKGKQVIERIVKKANEEATKWGNVIDIFNDRFSVPFVVKMGNQDDVILKSDAPTIKFEFKDSDDSTAVSVKEADLWDVLSSGERRALYILNIIFEVEARKEVKQETLFVVDDIADSFDYKNKYAIIEYLKDICSEDNFYQIILSHNFDFYRTISSRLDIGRQNKLHTIKANGSIKLVQEKYQNDPFSHWKDHLNDDEMLIASIPFVRNLTDYCGFNELFAKLTSLLHQRQDTDGITIGDLESIIKEVLKDQQNLTLENQSSQVKQLIFSLSESIYNETDEIVELEKKIVLSIAIRLKAEGFMIENINDDDFVNGITKHQTFELIKKYKEKFPSKLQNIKLLERVNLMTPENIHLNSCMYEPILDMSNEYLKQLYADVSGLVS